MHEHDIIYVLIKGIHRQSHYEYKTSANRQGKTCGISQIKHAIILFTLITKIATLIIRLAYPTAEPEVPESDMMLC